jgi:hypothetical protein
VVKGDYLPVDDRLIGQTADDPHHAGYRALKSLSFRERSRAFRGGQWFRLEKRFGGKYTAPHEDNVRTARFGQVYPRWNAPVLGDDLFIRLSAV